MTRKEEIEKAAKIRADQYSHPIEWNECYRHFKEGAEWADKNPEEDLRNRIQMRLDRISRYPDDLHCTMYQMKAMLKDFLK